MPAIFLHLLIAFIWLFLSESRDLPSLIIGWVIGWTILYLFRSLFPHDRYLKASVAFFAWMGSFCKAFLLSQIRVAQTILFPKSNPIDPGYIEFSIQDLTDWERIILTHTISLTPGTTSVEIDAQTGMLTIHALHASSPEEIIQDIRKTLLEPLLKVTRP